MRLLVLLLACSTLLAMDVDPWRWLEEVEGANALAWVRGMNQAARATIEDETFHARPSEVL